jgi:hypothetical protein
MKHVTQISIGTNLQYLVSCLTINGHIFLTIWNNVNLFIQKFSTHFSSTYSIMKNQKNQMIDLGFTKWPKSKPKSLKLMLINSHAKQ